MELHHAWSGEQESVCKSSRTSLTSEWMRLVKMVSSPFKKLNALEPVSMHQCYRSIMNGFMKILLQRPLSNWWNLGKQVKNQRQDLKTEELILLDPWEEQVLMIFHIPCMIVTLIKLSRIMKKRRQLQHRNDEPKLDNLYRYIKLNPI